MIEINLTNQRCHVSGDIKIINKLKKIFSIRHPNSFFIRQMSNNTRNPWDGFVKYITDAGYFKAGLFPSVIKSLEELGVKYEVYDQRKLPTFKGFDDPFFDNFRPYQLDTIRAIADHVVGGITFPRGVINEAPNAGKTYIMAGIFKAYKSKTLVIINDSDLFDQFKREIPKLLPNDSVGFMRGKEIVWGDFMILMVKTALNNLDRFEDKLRSYPIICVDECDLSDNKTYKSVLKHLYSAPLLVGLSGTIFISKLAKHRVSNMNLRELYGEEVYKVTSQELTELGVSTPVVVKIFKGNQKLLKGLSFPDQYRAGITENDNRHHVIHQRVLYNLKTKKTPILIVCQYHDHIVRLFKYLSNRLPGVGIEYVHHKTPWRAAMFERFRTGELKVLISSFIVKRGKNIPLTKVVINASGSDSAATALQILGRLSRTDKSKSVTYLEDFMDEGLYLKRHSKHRVIYYKNDKRKVITYY